MVRYVGEHAANGIVSATHECERVCEFLDSCAWRLRCRSQNFLLFPLDLRSTLFKKPVYKKIYELLSVWKMIRLDLIRGTKLQSASIRSVFAISCIVYCQIMVFYNRKECCVHGSFNSRVYTK